jgi:hypothetical protein
LALEPLLPKAEATLRRDLKELKAKIWRRRALESVPDIAHLQPEFQGQERTSPMRPPVIRHVITEYGF